jgi:DNA repair protein RAD5
LQSDAKKKDGKLFKHQWHRVILDEAHTIKNQRTENAKACFSLVARNRWAVSGTPIQNEIDDLYSLVKFLKVEPWCDYAFWTKSIVVPFKQNTEDRFENLRN